MNKRKILPFILPIAIIIFWYVITNGLHLVEPYVLPGPVDVLNSAIKIIQSGKLLKNTVDTLFKVFCGLIIASVVAIPLGILFGWYQTLEDLTSFIISILRPIPPVAWIPFSILWFGIGTVPAVFIIFMGCVFPILVYTMDGVKRTDKVLIESAQTLGANDWHILRRVIWPSAIPYIVSGLKVGVGIALMCTISAEMIGSSSGLGYMILTATNLFDTGTTVVGMLVIGLIGLVLDYIFGRVQKRIFW
ncbi:ABC transporter permease [Methanobrevibacter millerae]|uniref:NitT/TauT family transport system permease protein n=1 Tax=Methanobrevibacter millerae TaxID=230361 RepID=A0A1G5X5A4_9EURY|nr:ABC transporter permease [Methanobrevibacter millerae]SDA65593.1 NitT/TauT family transport system permease protein [Methanobrevibacter millerae]